MPESIKKDTSDALTRIYQEDSGIFEELQAKTTAYGEISNREELERIISVLEQEMSALSRELKFEQAAEKRDEISRLRQQLLFMD